MLHVDIPKITDIRETKRPNKSESKITINEKSHVLSTSWKIVFRSSTAANHSFHGFCIGYSVSYISYKHNAPEPRHLSSVGCFSPDLPPFFRFWVKLSILEVRILLHSCHQVLALSPKGSPRNSS